MAQVTEQDGRGPDADDVPRRRIDPVAAARRTHRESVRAPIKLGRYTLLDRIGRGGFGVVYRALDPLLHREVASKLLRSRKNVEGGAEALIHEARMAAQLQHPHVVRIFDVGRVEGDWSAYGADVFIIMELLDGMPLSKWLRQEKRTDREIVEMFLQMADGLAAAHQQGIVHCDVKPGNVFVTEAGEAKVLDFGLSRHSSQRTRTTLTPGAPPTETAKHRVIAGTRPYMAPEAHAGRDPDAAADQYSFGLALIEAADRQAPQTRTRQRRPADQPLRQLRRRPRTRAVERSLARQPRRDSAGRRRGPAHQPELDEPRPHDAGRGDSDRRSRQSRAPHQAER